MRAAGPDIDPNRQRQRCQTKHNRHIAGKLPVKTLRLHQRMRHIHTHVPDRHGHRHHHEGQLVTPQHNHCRGQRSKLQCCPAPVDKEMVVRIAVARTRRPKTQQALQAPHHQRHQGDGQRRQNASRYVQSTRFEVVRDLEAGDEIGRPDRQQACGSKCLKTQRHEQ